MLFDSPLYLTGFIIALLIVTGLAFYAGRLLYLLREQNRRQHKARTQRLETLLESIQTIAHAMSQQQCNLSEGAIRLINLIDSLPIETVPDCERDYPALFELYVLVKDLPTHQARKALDKATRARQDKIREEHEVRLESAILKEVEVLRVFNPSL